MPKKKKLPYPVIVKISKRRKGVDGHVFEPEITLFFPDSLYISMDSVGRLFWRIMCYTESEGHGEADTVYMGECRPPKTKEEIKACNAVYKRYVADDEGLDPDYEFVRATRMAPMYSEQARKTFFNT